MQSDLIETYVLLFTGMTVIMQIIIWIFAMIFSIGTIVFMLICRYKIFQKAGYEGWEAIVPFYSGYIMSEITMGNGWWFLLTFVPCVGVVIAYIMIYRLGMAFQKEVGFNIGLILVPIVFMAILAFEKKNTYCKLPPI